MQEHLLPRTRITTLELSKNVNSLRRYFKTRPFLSHLQTAAHALTHATRNNNNNKEEVMVVVRDPRMFPFHATLKSIGTQTCLEVANRTIVNWWSARANAIGRMIIPKTRRR